jgi:hypothetical protein
MKIFSELAQYANIKYIYISQAFTISATAITSETITTLRRLYTAAIILRIFQNVYKLT